MTKTQRHTRMAKIVAAFQKYVATYDQQSQYLDYEDRTFIKDMIYGVGIAIDPERFRGAGGFAQFNHEIRRHLDLIEASTGDAAEKQP